MIAWRPFWLPCAALLAAGALQAQEVSIEMQSRGGGGAGAASRALERANAAVLGLHTTAIEGARSARTLGKERLGSGVVISADGLVLTIGYLILEADEVDLVTDDEREIPARVLGYDVATGFGLVQALAPLAARPVPLGDSAATREDESLLIMSGGRDGDIGPARLVSRRGFSGYWEYHVDGALFTSPPRRDHSGAGLFNLRGELLGIGSLYVNDALGAGDSRLPGNMFVPIDLLKPILTELRERGSSRASARAWIGINCVEQGGQVRIVRISDDSPADVAGLKPGDRILRIDGAEVAGLEQLWKRLWAGASPEREVKLEVERDDERQSFSVQSVDRAKTLRRAQGI
jgi:S1-C subfamily serine protease